MSKISAKDVIEQLDEISRVAAQAAKHASGSQDGMFANNNQQIYQKAVALVEDATAVIRSLEQVQAEQFMPKSVASQAIGHGPSSHDSQSDATLGQPPDNDIHVQE